MGFGAFSSKPALTLGLSLPLVLMLRLMLGLGLWLGVGLLLVPGLGMEVAELGLWDGEALGLGLAAVDRAIEEFLRQKDQSLV